MHQILVDFGTVELFGLSLNLRVFGYGLMLVAGFLSAIALAGWRARRMGERPERISQCGLLALLGGVVGARIAYIIYRWETFADAPLVELVNVTSGGLIYFGGLIGGTLVVLAFLFIKKLPARRFIDIIAPSLMLGLAFGRVGCLLNGCCWGGPCQADWPAAMHFPMVSTPVIKLDDSNGPFSPDQALSPPYSDLYWAGQVQPDPRLVNSFATVAQTHDGGEPVLRHPPLPMRDLHGPLASDQLATMLAPQEQARTLFEQAAGPDGLLDESEFYLTRGETGGFLRGSESWAAAKTFAARNELTFPEAWAYLQQRRDNLLARFDADGDGQFDPAERRAANDYLQADLYALVMAEHTPARRPAQVLGIINGLLLCGLLLFYSRHRRFEGRLFALMLILYPITRFVLESIRHENPFNVISGDLTHSQIISIILLAVGVLFWWQLGRMNPSCGPVATQRENARSDETTT